MSSHDIVALIGHVVWPFTVVAVLLVFRQEIRDVGKRIAARVADPNTNVALTREGIHLSTRVESLEGAIEGQQLRSGVLVRTVERASVEHASIGIPEALADLAAEYRAIDEPDHRRKVEKKNELADAMGALVLKQRVDRRELADQHDEVMTLALASASIAVPSASDPGLLLAAGQGVDRLHVRYRVAAAFAQLASSDLLDVRRADDVRNLLTVYGRGADAPLRRRLDRTRAAFSVASHQDKT